MAEQKRAKRLMLIENALALFGDQGYHATTVPQIVSRSRSSTGSFYFYFRNKEDIFNAALETVGDHLAAVLNHALEDSSDVFSQMRAAIQHTFLFLATNPKHARLLLIESSGLSQRLEVTRQSIFRSHERSVLSALEQVRDRLPPIDLQVAAQFWVGAVHEVARSWLQTDKSQRKPPEQVAANVAAFTLRAVGAPNSV